MRSLAKKRLRRFTHGSALDLKRFTGSHRYWAWLTRLRLAKDDPAFALARFVYDPAPGEAP